MLYDFRCDECNHRFTLDLPIGEIVEDCPKCETKGSVSKMLNEFSIRRSESEPLTKPVGKEMAEHIEDNKEILEQLKNDRPEFLNDEEEN